MTQTRNKKELKRSSMKINKKKIKILIRTLFTYDEWKSESALRALRAISSTETVNRYVLRYSFLSFNKKEANDIFRLVALGMRE
jgi:hypothetical protein